MVNGGLELWKGHSCAEGLFREILWGGTFGEFYKRPLCWVQHRSLNNETGHSNGTSRSKQSRTEKKSRKAMLKLGMKSVPSVSHVTVKKSKNVSTLLFSLFFCISV
ncbi:uncharacterized protein LOC113326918 [Papaver somniferum]|uniref:uncharacterized protein LOC113326918 n=1 Tax=Papaver somniferum TaxID=3469 RepID=UPI000E705FE5|nr:uncharacterized protein LOC113326918 [Papaver somniferum]